MIWVGIQGLARSVVSLGFTKVLGGVLHQHYSEYDQAFSRSFLVLHADRVTGDLAEDSSLPYLLINADS